MIFNWDIWFPSTEKGYKNESMYTTLFYRYKDGDIEKFNARGKKDVSEETATTKVDWIAFKHQFFSTILIGCAGWRCFRLRWSCDHKYFQNQ